MVKHGVNRGEYDTAYVEGLPIHYYLSRTSNLDLDTVKVLVDAYPNCFMNADGEMEFYPIVIRERERGYVYVFSTLGLG